MDTLLICLWVVLCSETFYLSPYNIPNLISYRSVIHPKCPSHFVTNKTLKYEAFINAWFIPVIKTLIYKTTGRKANVFQQVVILL